MPGMQHLHNKQRGEMTSMWVQRLPAVPLFAHRILIVGRQPQRLELRSECFLQCRVVSQQLGACATRATSITVTVVGSLLSSFDRRSCTCIQGEV